MGNASETTHHVLPRQSLDAPMPSGVKPPREEATDYERGRQQMACEVLRMLSLEPQQIRRLAGELTAREMLAVQAILIWGRQSIRNVANV